MHCHDPRRRNDTGAIIMKETVVQHLYNQVRTLWNDRHDSVFVRERIRIIVRMLKDFKKGMGNGK